MLRSRKASQFSALSVMAGTAIGLLSYQSLRAGTNDRVTGDNNLQKTCKNYIVMPQSVAIPHL